MAAIKLSGVLCAATALLLATGSVQAEPLDEPACNRLKNEQARLASEGLKTDMLRGPAWAKANLPQAKLDEIKQLMEIEEQLAFRCPLPKPPPSQTTTAAAPAGEAVPGEPGTGPAKKARSKKKAKETSDSDSLLDALPTPDAAPAPDEKPKKVQKKVVKPKKKEPANDAYVPPPPSGNAFVDGEAGPVPQAPANPPAQSTVAP